MTHPSDTTPAREAILEPALPIVDPHHHLWDRPDRILTGAPPKPHGFHEVLKKVPRYLLDELRADIGSGHNVVATVYMECGAYYRADGPAEMKPVGEIEFVAGVAAMSASGLYGDARACLGIVGHVDLTRGAASRDWRRVLGIMDDLEALEERA